VLCAKASCWGMKPCMVSHLGAGASQPSKASTRKGGDGNEAPGSCNPVGWVRPHPVSWYCTPTPGCLADLWPAGDGRLLGWPPAPSVVRLGGAAMANTLPHPTHLMQIAPALRRTGGRCRSLAVPLRRACRRDRSCGPSRCPARAGQARCAAGPASPPGSGTCRSASARPTRRGAIRPPAPPRPDPS